jgi:hypothetical protein
MELVVQELEWRDRVSPYNRPGCVGIHLKRVGIDDEGQNVSLTQTHLCQAQIFRKFS